MSNKLSRTPTALVLDISPSRSLRKIYFCLILLALCAIANSRLALFIQVFLALLTLIYGVLLLKRHVPTSLRFNAGWYLSLPQRGELALQLTQTTVWPMLMVLRFRDPIYSRISRRSSHSLLLLRDNLSADDWRHLRIYLRHFNVYGDLSVVEIN